MADLRSSTMRRAAVVLIAIVLISQATPILAGQKAPNQASGARFNLTIDNIMRGPELVGYEPRAVRWSGDSQRVYFQWKQATDGREKDYDTYVVSRDGSGLRKLSEEEAKNAPPLNGDTSKDKSLTVFADNGDIFLYRNATGRRERLTGTTDLESNPHFTFDQKKVYFTRSNNLFTLSLETGALIQLTDIRAAGAAPQVPAAGGFGQGQGRGGQQGARDSSEQKGTDSQEYIKKEERDLLDIIKQRAERRQEEEARRKRENPRKPFNLGPRQSVASLQLSPDEKLVTALLSEGGDGTKNTVVANYVTESAYTEDIASRNKVGDNQAHSRLAILNVESGDVKWMDHGQKEPPSSAGDTQVTGGQSGMSRETNQAPQQPDSGSRQAQGRDVDPRSRRGNEHRERDVQVFQPLWSDDGSKAVVLARSGDNKDRWIFSLDATTGKTKVAAAFHDDAWIDGPGAFTLGWLADNNRIYYQSERDGYAHLYTGPADGGVATQLTSGNWEVSAVHLSNDKKQFYLTTSEVGPGERHLYSVPVEGGPRVKITSMPGSNQSFLSPDEKMIALIYSYSNKPPEIYLQENRPDAKSVKVTSSPAPDFWSYNWIDPPIVKFAARDGAQVSARFYKPATFKRGGPAVIFVHGAGYAQNVHRYWSSYFREYMFHHYLMDNGYIVMDVDYRASSGYGRDWRTGIYRHMGGKDLDDQIDAAKWLVSEQGVDAKRIGIYGGSYGGFITLMAMFTQPDVFAAGAALRPVTDWAHYNHPYTSNILNLPQKDSEAYRLSSPIYFAAGLKGALLICHGMVDTNVHFQDTVRLVQKLIELRKTNWELAVYPVEDHGFNEPASWADEYKRIFKLFETNLKEGLPAAH